MILISDAFSLRLFEELTLCRGKEKFTRLTAAKLSLLVFDEAGASLFYALGDACRVMKPLLYLVAYPSSLMTRFASFRGSASIV